MNKSNNLDLTVKESNQNYVTIGGYASVFGLVDSHNDIMAKGAFSRIKPLEEIKFLWQHDVTKPIGVVTSVIEDDYGLYIEANVNNLIRQGVEAIELIKQGAISSFSVGFTVQKAYNNSEGQREIISADLWEISLVTFPANNKAQINSIKKSLNDNFTKTNYLLDKAICILAKINS